MKSSLPLLGLISAVFGYLAVFDGNPFAAVWGCVYYAAFWDIVLMERRRA